MQIKRLIVVGASLAVGAVLTWAIVTFGFGTNFYDFAYSNDFLLFISLACMAGIWLDYALDTRILKS